MSWLMFALLWVACGILGYGMCKGWWECSCRLNKLRFDFWIEMVCLFALISGPGGVVVCLFMNIKFGYWKITYRMPKELREK